MNFICFDGNVCGTIDSLKECGFKCYKEHMRGFRFVRDDRLIVAIVFSLKMLKFFSITCFPTFIDSLDVSIHLYSLPPKCIIRLLGMLFGIYYLMHDCVQC